jgi:hypothetical protein
MARTINEIYDAIIVEKNTRSSLDGLAPANETSTQLLDDLNSDSKVAIWRLWAYITAVAIHAHEVVWDLFKKDVEDIANSAPAGTPAWYRKKVFEFQLGDALEYIGTVYKYAVIDPLKQIVTRCSIDQRGSGLVVVKVAKGETGALEPLIQSESDALQAYINKIKFAGTRMIVFSGDPDQLTMNYDIYYDPIIQLDVLQEKLTNAINAYLNEELPFNAELNVTGFTDVLQTVEGVEDPIFQSGSALAGSTVRTFEVDYVPASGYFVLADSVDNMFNFIQTI